MNDCHVFDFEERSWAGLATEGAAPIPRDSHVAVVHGGSMFVFGGSTGSAMNDFHELRLDTKKWQPVHALGGSPGPRFCHVATVHGDSMLVSCSLYFPHSYAPALWCCGLMVVDEAPCLEHRAARALLVHLHLGCLGITFF